MFFCGHFCFLAAILKLVAQILQQEKKNDAHIPKKQPCNFYAFVQSLTKSIKKASNRPSYIDWNRIEYYNAIFAVFHLRPLQLLINNSVFYYNICCFSTERHIQSEWIILSYDHRSILEKYILEIKRLNCLTANFLGFDFDLERSFYRAIRKPVLDFISIFYWHFFLHIEPFWRYLTSTHWDFDSIFHLWRSSEVKNIFAIRKSIHHFLSNFYRHFLFISYCFRDIRLQSFHGLTVTFDL